jgi:putative ATP-binding cassette transporter
MEGLGQFLKDAWHLSRPYFMQSEERWSARALLLAVVMLSLIMVGLTVLFNFWRAEFYNALENKDWDSFINLLLYYHRTDKGLTFGFAPLAFLFIGIAIYEVYLNQWLQIRWRRWMTNVYLKDWLTDRAYYRIAMTPDRGLIGTDNPDQRIAEDIREFCEATLTLTLGLLSRIVSLVSFLTILWGLSGALTLFGITIPGYLFWISLIYAIAGTIATHFVGRPLAALNFRQQRVEADFRYALVRLRENAEGVALLRGEPAEQATLLNRFGALIGNWHAIMTRTKLLNLVTVGYSQAGVIFPILLIAPRYFAGQVTLGQMFQTVDAFGRVQDALSWVVDSYRSIAAWRAVVERLATFERAIAAAHVGAHEGFIKSDSTDGSVHLRGVDMLLPNGTKLLDGADLDLTRGHSVVISGASGSGKSTLFRVISGIWPFGQGRVEVPPNSFFLPQRPYIPLGTLKHVLTYPHPPEYYTEAEITQALADAGLPRLADFLDRDDNWAARLSGGEQQRVALVRALLARPDWLFLDEATASLDPAGEEALYRVLRDRLPHATLISIAHRPSVAAFHDARLVFRRGASGPGALVSPAQAE